MAEIGKESGSRPVSRVLSWAIIHLGLLSPASSSDLPEDIAGRDIVFLFGLAPGGVYHATSCYQLRGALLPHHFTLTCPHNADRRYIFCCTFRRLAPPRRYLAPCPVEPGLSSLPHNAETRLPGRLSRLLSHKSRAYFCSRWSYNSRRETPHTLAATRAAWLRDR